MLSVWQDSSETLAKQCAQCSTTISSQNLTSESNGRAEPQLSIIFCFISYSLEMWYKDFLLITSFTIQTTILIPLDISLWMLSFQIQNRQNWALDPSCQGLIDHCGYQNVVNGQRADNYSLSFGPFCSIEHYFIYFGLLLMLSVCFKFFHWKYIMTFPKSQEHRTKTGLLHHQV